MKYFLFAITLFITTSCWRMPQEGEASVLPNTNNPSIHHHPESALPGFAY